MIFSQRYKDLIEVGNGEPIDHICGEIDFDVKKQIASVMIDFAEPSVYHPSRYDNWEENTDALEIAAKKLNAIVEYPVMNYMITDFTRTTGMDMSMASIFTPYLFDLVELQYEALSNSEKEPFRNEINAVFNNCDISWIIADGRLVKIDAKQFEQDLKLKALEQLHELKDSAPVFQSAYDELVKAVEFVEKGDYAEAITNAEKSYESVMKIICRVDKGNADFLTKKLLDGEWLSIPASMKGSGFREKVLMSLPFIRNNVGSHGSGMNVDNITKPLANLAVDLAAAFDTYLIEEYKRDA